MPNKPFLVLTRPASRQQGLIQLLTGCGMPVLALPALSIEPLNAPEIIQSDFKFYNLIIFVSRAAVEYFPSNLNLDLNRTLLAAVGAQTALAIRQRFGSLATVLCPPEGARQDSEALWQVLTPTLRSVSQVLIVRAETGRDWLRDQIVTKGCQVDFMAVYTRKPCVWSAEQAQKLNTALTFKTPLIWLFTSAESVDAVMLQLNELGIEPSKAIQGVIVTHAKVLERASRLFTTVNFDNLSHQKDCAVTPYRVVAPCDEEILQGLMKLSKFMPP